MHAASERFYAAALERGFEAQITAFEQPTRTAQEAAEAIGCDVAQIVKSLCFSVKGAPVMALVSGANRLDTRKLAALCDVGRKQVKRADADFVRQATGFAIGGVPPFGHASQMAVYIDEDLTGYEEVWAAAGTPYAVFPIAPQALVSLAEGRVADLKVEA
jgi:Cys-tRNA(Pro) deacylase